MVWCLLELTVRNWKFDFYPAFTLYYGIIQCIRGNIDMIGMNRFISDLPYRPKFIEVLVKDKKVLAIYMIYL